VARSWILANVLWLAACGRLGFDAREVAGADATLVGPHAQLGASAVGTTTECGVPPSASGTLVVANTGDQDLAITAAVVTGGFAVSTPLPLAIPPGGSATLAISPPPAVVGTDLANSIKLGTLALATNDPAALPIVELSAQVIGANVAFATQAMPITQVVFSALSSCPMPQDVVIKNTGSLPATVAFTGTSNVTFSGFSGGTLDASSSAAMILHALTTGACGVTGGYLLYTVTGSVCTTTPATLDVKIDIGGSTSCVCS